MNMHQNADGVNDKLSENGKIALEYAERGFKIFPCQFGTNDPLCSYNPITGEVPPAGERGCKMATTDADIIRAWWKLFPDAVIGWRIPQSFVAVDLDFKRENGVVVKNGRAALEDRIGTVPDTPFAAVSGSGEGEHLIYRVPGGEVALTATDINKMPGVDTRANTGYIIIAPSKHRSGNKYRWKPTVETAANGVPVDDLETLLGRCPNAPRAVLQSHESRARKQRERVETLTEELKADLREALSYLDPAKLSYNDWLNIGFALSAYLGNSEDGLALWDEWSARDTSRAKHGGPRYNPAALGSRWVKFRNDDSGVQIGTLIAMVEAAGGRVKLRDAFTKEREARAKQRGKGGKTGSTSTPPDDDGDDDAPVPLVAAASRPAPFPVEALGGLRAAVREVQAHMQAPAAMVAGSALAAAATVLQGFANVETHFGGACPLSLYVATVAQSGERKTACDNTLLDPVRAWEEAAVGQFRREMENWTRKDAARKATEKAVLARASRRAARDDNTEDESTVEIEAGLDDLETALGFGEDIRPPRDPKRIVGDATYEGLRRQFATGAPALGLLQGEGGLFVGGHGMSGDQRMKTTTGFNALWDGSEISTVRAGEAAQYLYHRRLSVHLMMQPGVARNLLSDAGAMDSGFLARFLLAEPESTIGQRFSWGSTCEKEARQALAGKLVAALDRPLPTDPETGALRPRLLPLSPEAKAMVEDYADDIEQAMGKGGEFASLTGPASKSAEQALRIAGILALVDDLDAGEVTAATMTNAITLARYYLGETARLAGDAPVDAQLDAARRLETWLLSNNWPGDFVTMRNIQREGPNSLRTKAAREAAVQTLVEHRRLRFVEDRAGGKLKKGYRLDRRPAE